MVHDLQFFLNWIHWQKKKKKLAGKWNFTKSTRFLATIKWTCFRRYWSLLIRLNELKVVKALCKLWNTIKNTLNHHLVVHCYVLEEFKPACKDTCLKNMSRYLIKGRWEHSQGIRVRVGLLEYFRFYSAFQYCLSIVTWSMN